MIICVASIFALFLFSLTFKLLNYLLWGAPVVFIVDSALSWRRLVMGKSPNPSIKSGRMYPFSFFVHLFFFSKYFFFSFFFFLEAKSHRQWLERLVRSAAYFRLSLLTTEGFLYDSFGCGFALFGFLRVSNLPRLGCGCGTAQIPTAKGLGFRLGWWKTLAFSLTLRKMYYFLHE